MALASGYNLLLLIGTLGISALNRWAHGQRNHTLVFPKGSGVRKCRCPTDLRDCDYSLASLLCSCRTVLPASGEPAAGAGSGSLTVWFTNASALGVLLNFTQVRDLKLSLCSGNTLPPEYLAICGLQRLRVSAQAWRGAPEQIALMPGACSKGRLAHPCASVVLLDMALFNRPSSLKAYSIEDVASVADNFPSFSNFKTLPILSNKSHVVTFIY